MLFGIKILFGINGGISSLRDMDSVRKGSLPRKQDAVMQRTGDCILDTKTAP